jgi:hypothetical protein
VVASLAHNAIILLDIVHPTHDVDNTKLILKIMFSENINHMCKYTRCARGVDMKTVSVDKWSLQSEQNSEITGQHGQYECQGPPTREGMTLQARETTAHNFQLLEHIVKKHGNLPQVNLKLVHYQIHNIARFCSFLLTTLKEQFSDYNSKSYLKEKWMCQVLELTDLVEGDPCTSERNIIIFVAYLCCWLVNMNLQVKYS